MGVKVLFLGAGASAPFGLPTTKEFFNKFFSPMGELPKLLQNPLPVLNPARPNQTKGRLIIINVLRAFRKLSDRDIFDAEEVHSWLSEWAKMLSQASTETITLHSLVVKQMRVTNFDYQQFVREWDNLLPSDSIGRVNGIKDAVESALKELRKELNLAYSVTDEQLRQAFEAWKPVFDEFVDRKHSLWIFTTNYDLLIDKMKRIGEFDENFELLTGFDQQGEFQGDFLLEARNKKTIVRLCKLHGSLHWVRRNNGEIEARNTLEEYPPCEHEGERAIVPLKAVKDEDIEEEPFKTLYSKFKELGHRADRVCIIGFSLRDESIQRLLLDMIKGNKSLKITIFNRSKSETIDRFIEEGRKIRNGSVVFRKGEFGKGDYQKAIIDILFK